jgi:H+-transporting ATPase
MSQPIVEKEAGPPADSDTPIEEKPATEKRVREYKEFGHDEEAKPARAFLFLGLRVDFRA